MQYNHLSQSPHKNTNALTCVPVFENSRKFNNAVLEAADNAGCQFLFEVPAGLFGLKESRAAAIRLNVFNERDQLAFIVCDTETGVIRVLSGDEAPTNVIRFVQSYAHVLSLLQESTTTSH